MNAAAALAEMAALAITKWTNTVALVAEDTREPTVRLVGRGKRVYLVTSP